MWRLIYNLLIHAALPFFVPFALTNRKIRKNLAERIFPPAAGNRAQDAIWIHAASVGEAVVAENLLAYARTRTDKDFVITTNTFYTRDLLRKKLGPSVEVFSLPFDLPLSLRRFLGRARFAALLIVETELWPNLIRAAKKRNIPVIIINGRISDGTIGRYKRLSFFMKDILSPVDLVLAQSQAHAKRFLSLGMPPSRVVNTGNLKYYREVNETGADGPRDIVTFGSIREKELPVLIPVMQALARDFPHLRLYVAPRQLTLIAAIERQLPGEFAVRRYSAMKAGRAALAGDGATPGRPPGGTHALVLVDTVGDLVGIYGRSLVAFVGGSLAPYGGQNLLEPLFVGTPVVFGPHVENFHEIAAAVVEHRAGFMVEDGEALLARMRLVLTDADERERLVAAGRAVLDLQKGAMEKTTSLILETIWKNSGNSSA
jgi:3-deoxy-D-manno-octulosonic-acid transferase